jgi:hypothetical protein
MSFRTSQHSQQPYRDPNAGAGAALVLGAVIGSIIAFVSLFSYAVIAGIVALIYIAAATTIGARLHIKFPDQLKLPKALLALSILCAIWAGVVVFHLQWLSFDVAAWIVTGLYVAGLVLRLGCAGHHLARHRSAAGGGHGGRDCGFAGSCRR